MSVMPDRISKVSVSIIAARSAVWRALINPAAARKWQGKTFKDHGAAVQVLNERTVQYSYVRPVGRRSGSPVDGHTRTIDLVSMHGGGQTCVTLWQDNNATEEALQESEQACMLILEGLKMFVEAQQ